MKSIQTIATLLDSEFSLDCGGYSGWHEQQGARHLNEHPDAKARYRPAIQQVRSEFLRFLEDCQAYVEKRGVGCSILQIGLGISGGSHFGLEQVFDTVCTIDVDRENIQRFCQRFHREYADMVVDHRIKKAPKKSSILYGSSLDPAIHAYLLAAFGQFDVCFIDGDHSFEGVKKDWEIYAPMVTDSGWLVFHDHVPTPHRLHERAVDMFLAWLKNQPNAPQKFVSIGHQLGITYYVKEPTDKFATGIPAAFRN
jgi:hypothetical protein